MLTALSRLHAWANHGWPAVWLQATAGLLIPFGVLCLIELRSDAVGLGGIYAFVQMFISDDYLSIVGWLCLVWAAILVAATIPFQKKKWARFKSDEAMLKRHDWRK